MAGMRARAIAKFPSLKTVIAVLMNNAFTHRKQTWASGASRWLKRAEIVVSTPANAKRHVQNATENRERDSDKSKGMMQYDENDFAGSREYVNVYSKLRANMDRGLAGLLAARTGGVMTGKRAAEQGLISEDYKVKCPFCGIAKAESMEHLLVDCRAWKKERRELLKPLVDLCPTMPAADLAIVLLGGRASTGFTLGHLWTHGGVDGHPLFMNLVKFFGTIFRRRSQRLWGADGLTARSEGAIA
jgi:hypothetical protein